MILYFARHFKSGVVGARLIHVDCEKCGCQYFFELARVGSGSAQAPYGIGSKRTARAAEERAQRALAERLDQDAELVPCPRCDWINEELVSRYRRGRYQGWAKFAACIAVVGTIVSLIGAWFVSIGPAADRIAVTYWWTLGPTISLALALLVLLGRNWLRRRIQPNRDYPLPPRLPPASPTAKIINPVTGQVETVTPRQTHDDATSEWIEFQVGRHELPPLCCECLDPSEPRAGHRRTVFPAVALLIPLCSGCARKWKVRMWLIGLATFAAAVASALLLLWPLGLDPLVFKIALIVVCGVTPLVAAGVAYRLTTPVRVKTVDASRGIVRLRFRHEEYRNSFTLTDGGAH